ncbi:hypothetical protein QWJ41_21110, partial [Nocardioides sp. SOB44]|nr:hypothetical protein [Nocardioides cremeus]
MADAQGAPPTIPFWLGEAPARSDELSRAVSDFRAEVEQRLADASSPAPRLPEWLTGDNGIPAGAADQLLEYFAEGRRVLGVIPTQDTI